MDSVSQLLLGAACGELVLGRRIGRRAMVLGAALGTLPDLDVLVPYADAIDAFTHHRGWSHSLFVLSAASLPIAVLARRLFGGERGRAVSLGRWWFGVWLALFTHPLLDSLTTYGTQLWWPLPVRPVAIGSTFIIDPLFTLPLAIGLVWAWRRRDARGRRANRIGLLLGTAWLGLTLLSQAQAGRVVRDSLAAVGGGTGGGTDGGMRVERGSASGAGSGPPTSPEASDVLLLPFPFALLWRVLVLDADGETYREGWYSLLDASPDVRFTSHAIGADLLDAVADDRRVARLDWFTGGFVGARERDGELVLTDLRIGAEGGYIFSFVAAERVAASTASAQGTVWRPVQARGLSPEIDPATLGLLARRAIDENVELHASGTAPGAAPNGNGNDDTEVPDR